MLTYPAPAKLNLFLHVLGRRDDGYHELQTLFQFLDFGDQLSFSIRKDGRIRRLTPVPGVSEADDLALRAARLLQDETGTLFGCDIHVDKRIPLGGGLGGGSSDAATTLLALNHLWLLGKSIESLAGLGQRLGADVPVFVHGHAALAEGIGEKLWPMELPESWFLVITPACTVSTRELFAAPELKRDSKRISIVDYFTGAGRNDFEPVVRARFPPVAEALDWLRAECSPRAALSGSGASVFAPFAGAEEARRAAERVPPLWRAVVARGLNVSPVRALLTV